MEIPADITGAAAGPLAHDIDARWLMAYAAGLGETGAEYLDSARPEGLLAHPLFPVCYEWPLAVELRGGPIAAIAHLSVHATHDLVLHRLPRAGDRLTTRAAVVLVEDRPPGAYVVTRFHTVDAEGKPVSTTDYGSIYRGVKVTPSPFEGEGGGEGGVLSPVERSVEGIRPSPCPLPGGERVRSRPSASSTDGRWSTAIAIAGTLAHVYTECARIWNPVHTDRAVALAAGLPDIILHGTATLALAVSAVLAREPAGAAARVRRIRCRFSGMVLMPSRITVEGGPAASAPGERVVAFRVLDGAGRVAVRDGDLTLARAEE